MLKDCRVVLIPTDHSEKSIIVHETSMMFSENLLTRDYLSSVGAKGHHMYITSNDKIEEGDWCYCRKPENSGDRKIIKVDSKSKVETFNLYEYYYKIIATTNPTLTIREIKGGEGDIIVKGINTPGVSRGFIDRFCGNNGSIVDIQVEFEEDWDFISDGVQECWHILKKREDNTIIIRQAQKYTLDDINTIVCNNTNYTYEEVNNWFKL